MAKIKLNLEEKKEEVKEKWEIITIAKGKFTIKNSLGNCVIIPVNDKNLRIGDYIII